MRGRKRWGNRLRKEGRLHVEFLERFGEDLLQVVAFLEEQGIPHRDIKPDNIGVGKVGHGDKLHLTLFDFSLSRTSPENIQAGTAGYREPFLSSRKPPRWDLHAERYATAVTLYELATGTRPKWGDGKSEPAVLECEAAIDAELFAASLREPLTGFFTKALRRNPAERFDNAEEMLQAWRACFRDVEKSVSTDHEDWEQVVARLEAATLATAIAELGLGASATDALDRNNILTVRHLVSVSIRKLARLPGIANRTRRSIVDAAKILRGRLRDAQPAGPTTLTGPETEPGEAPGSQSVDVIAARVAKGNPRARSDTERRFLRAFLGLDDAFDFPWAAQKDIADYLGVTRGRIGQLVGPAQRRWKKDAVVTQLRAEVVDLIASQGGIVSVEELAQAVRLARGSVEDDPIASRNAAAAVRAAVETERAMAEPRFVVRRNRACVLVALAPEMAEYAVLLGREADKFAAQESLAPPVRVLERLRSFEPPSGMEPLSDARLLRVAVMTSEAAALSSRREIYPRNMDAARALKLAQGALLGAKELSIDEIRLRVSGRYPDAEPLPNPPELDALLRQADFEFNWDPTAKKGEGAYRIPMREWMLSSHTSSALSRGMTDVPVPPGEITPELAQARQFDERLERAAKDGSFIAMTVAPKGYYRAQDRLCERFPVEAVDMEALFIAALREEAEKAKAKWDVVLRADAAPGSDDWNRLMVLVRRAVPRVEKALAEAEKTVLLVFPGLLARYEQMDLLTRLREKVGRRDGIPGLWMLIPTDEQSPLPMMEGKAVPVIGPAEWARVPERWIYHSRPMETEGRTAKTP